MLSSREAENGGEEDDAFLSSRRACLCRSLSLGGRVAVWVFFFFFLLCPAFMVMTLLARIKGKSGEGLWGQSSFASHLRGFFSRGRNSAQRDGKRFDLSPSLSPSLYLPMSM